MQETKNMKVNFSSRNYDENCSSLNPLFCPEIIRLLSLPKQPVKEENGSFVFNTGSFFSNAPLDGHEEAMA